jgi:hypothetical protein
MLSPSAPTNRKIILLAAAMLAAGTSITFGQGGGVGGGVSGGGTGGARGGATVPSTPPPTPSALPPVVNPSSPNTVPQSSSTPLTPSTSGTTPGTTPSTPSTASSGEVTPPANEEPQNTTARSVRRASLAKKALGPPPSSPLDVGYLFLRLFRLRSYLCVGVSVSILQPLLFPGWLHGVGPLVARLL